MNNPRRPPYKISHLFLWQVWGNIVAGCYAMADWLTGAWRSYDSAIWRFRPNWLWSLMVNLASWALTGVIAFAMLFIAFSRPAFVIANKDWRKQQQLSVVFLDRYGAEIGRRGVLRDKSQGTGFPAILIQATLATEDRRFFDHFGIDFRGLGRAIIEDIRTNTIAQGGSSITQQLAKNIYLSPEKTLSRKVLELFLALWLEAKYTKIEILGLYLNSVYLGGGATGITAAARYYFAKPLNELSLSEVAMLVGLFKAPSRYGPYNDLLAARNRANTVLNNLVKFGFMSENQVAQARENPATPIERLETYSPNYFLDWVFNEVKKIVPESASILTVKTTADIKAQRTGETVLRSALRQYSEQYKVSQAALVALESDGAVIAMTGGWNYAESQFNRAVNALRQPGSAFKLFVYATALQRGYKPGSTIYDAPISIGGWSPQNYTKKYRGRVSLTTALSSSLNTAAVRLGAMVGRRRIAKLAHSLGITSKIRPTPSLPLGTSEVSLLELTSAYGAFANHGNLVVPYGIISITDDQDRLIYRHQNRVSLVLSPTVVRNINYMLSSVVNYGTGRRAYIKGIPVAGKTGTTQSYRDAWFVGFTGNLIAGIWFGNDDYSPTKRLTGGTLPALSWQWFMTLVHAGKILKPIDGVATKPSPGIYANRLTADNLASSQNKAVKATIKSLEDIKNTMQQAIKTEPLYQR